MRTRRSPKNQERLWKYLAGDAKPTAPKPQQKTPSEIDAMFWIPKWQREQMKRDAIK